MLILSLPYKKELLIDYTLQKYLANKKGDLMTSRLLNHKKLSVK